MGGGGEGGSNGGGEKELIETVLTCEGSISDPQLPAKILLLIHHLQIITHCESNDWQVRKVEPWNSVRVTFSIPKEAANRLQQLAQAGDTALRQLGILSVQVEGDQIVSLKVAGPNNETAEIVLRSESACATPSVSLGMAGPSSADSVVNPTVARSVTQALNNAGMLPGFSQTQHHQPHPVPQFRSPTISSGADGGVPVVVGRTSMVQPRPLQTQGQQPPPSLQGFAYAGVGSGAPTTLQTRHTQQPAQPQQAPHLPSAGTSFPHPPLSSPVVARPVFPTNPPPPYPTLELRTSAPTPSQIGSGSQSQHQYVVSPARSVITPPPQQAVLQHAAQPIGTLNSLPQSMAGGYRVAGTQASAPATSAVAHGRGQVRTQVSMVKNSPLLVGLLQQPEHSSSSSVVSRTAKGGSVNLPQGASVPPSATLATSPPSTSLENGPLPGVISANAGPVNSGTYIGRSRDGFTTHQQIFSGGSVITNSVPPPPPSRHQSGPAPGLVPSPSSPAPRLANSDDHRRGSLVGSAPGLVGGSSGVGKSSTNNHLSSTLGSTSASSGVKDEAKGGGPSKKESQYLINPNTGLLELRPNTDSSDSEAEEQVESPSHEEPRPNSLASDDESNLSAASHKETDHSDSELSRVSAASADSRKLVNCERGKSQDRDSSPGSSWENNMISSSPGEIRLRLKLGKEQVAQATIVGNANKKADRRGAEFPLNAGISSSNSMEPRVPKLHIKLHSSQPVIVKAVEDTDTSNRKSLKELTSSTREDKNKRKSGRSKPRNELDLDSVKSKNLKLKMIKDKTCEEDVTSQLLKILEPKRSKQESEFDEGALVRYKDTAESRLKGPRMLEVTKPSKVESKLRTRLKKTPMRKVGDLNSLGEIASHKIMETLPPSITKVAAMHTQQPHRNPNASSPIPFSSITTSMFSGSSISASPVTTSSCLSLSTPSSASSCLSVPMVGGVVSQAAAGDLQLKAELEKRGSEIIQKTDMKVDVEKNGSDVVMTKVCMNSPAIKNLMNGDVTHSEKMTINQMRFKRAGSIASQSDFPSTTKLTIKRKNTEETHSLKALKKEGLGSVPTLLNSSVLINKVSPDKSSVSSLSSSHRQSEDLSEKLLKKVESIKGPLRSEIAGLKSNSDITIHSVSKGDILGLSKGSDFERRTDLTIKTKPEVTKVGRVTCVDVMDRKALEEALKSSRNSSKKNDMFKSTSCMVARLSRWNSIDNSNPVPLSSHSHQQASDSTNLNSGSVKAEPKDSGDSESEKSVILSTVIEKVKTESDVSQQSNTIINVNNDKDCDNSGKDNFSSPNLKSENKIARQEAVLESGMAEPKPEEGEDEETKPPVHLKRDVANVECNSKATSTSLMTTTITTTGTSVTHASGNSSSHDTKLLNAFETSSGDAEAVETASKAIREHGKLADSGGSISLAVKSEVESPEGTPKGEHGNGQGGEDSGIESMDALSEKSPNHSDQSPNRRDEKDCEMFPDKCKVKAVGKKTSISEAPRNTMVPSTAKTNCNEGLGKVESVSKEQVPFADRKSTIIDPISQLTGPVEPLLTKTEPSSGNSLNSQTGERNQSNQEASAMGTQGIPTRDSKICEKSECDSENSPGKSLFSEGDQPFLGNVIYGKTETLPSTMPPEECHAISVLRKGTVATGESLSGSCPQLSVSKGCDVARATLCTDITAPECPNVNIDPTSAEESLSSSHNKLSDPRPVTESSLNTPLRKASETELCSTVDLPPSPVVCSVSLSLTTTSLSVASPKTSVITSPSVLLHPSVSVPPIPNISGTLSQGPTKDISQANMLLSTSKESLAINSGFKPSLLAITLSRPPGASIMTSQYATSIANSMETMTTTGAAPAFYNITTTTSTPTTSAVNKMVSSLESQSNTNNIVYCHSLSCNNNSLAYCNSYTTTTSTTATMIILAASTSSTSTTITTPPNSTKMVTLKPSLNPSSTSPINPPVGKTFRLVALPGINSMTPASSPVKGQLVTLKPVVGSGVATSIAKNSHLLQTVPALKSEDPGNSSILKTQVSTSVISSVDSPLPSATLEPISGEGHLEDLDFVGFSSVSETEPKETADTGSSYKHSPPITPLEKPTLKPPNILSLTEEEPTPMRVHPPLYTYGNRERKKEVELEGEDRERDPQTDMPGPIKLASATSEITTENDSDVKDDESLVKTKEKKLHALTIEIPNVESFPDDKRLTRSTRQSARLASPKVNSPASSELSPRSDKRSPANVQTMGKPSPVGILRTSVSPALRLTKRRHESESSSASNVSEDQVEPPSKTARRKASEKAMQHDTKDESLRAKVVKREMDHEKERGESSDDESLLDEDGMKRRNLSAASSSTNEDEDDSSRPSSRTGRLPAKSTPRARDRTVAGDAMYGVRDTTPTRRTARQNRVSTPSAPPAAANSPASIEKPVESKDLVKEVKEKPPPQDLPRVAEEAPKDCPPKEGEKKIVDKKGVVQAGGKEAVKGLPKLKMDSQPESDSSNGRRKTRSSTTNVGTVSEEVNKRRRICKDK